MDETQLLDVVVGMLRGSGLSLADLERRLATTELDSTPVASSVPTLLEHVTKVEAALPRNTRRTWHTHFQRLVDGVPPQCDCLCDKCLDIEVGCQCQCRACVSSSLTVAPAKHRLLVKQAFRHSEVDVFATVAQRMSQKRARRDNARRALRGLAPKPEHGKGGRENAVTALRHLFGRLVDDELWSTNPADKVTKPRRNDTRRRALRDEEIPVYLDAVVAGGDDPTLDLFLAWFHLESGARRSGAIELQVGRLKPATQMVELYEKGNKVADQPVSAELLRALDEFAVRRGGDACDRKSPSYDPSRPVFYYRPPGRSRRSGSPESSPAPLTSRRYDTLHARVQKTLPWANEISLTSHCLRRTGASIVERIAGNQTARLFLRHGTRTVTDTYTQSSLERLASAVAVFTGSPHPMASPHKT